MRWIVLMAVLAAAYWVWQHRSYQHDLRCMFKGHRIQEKTIWLDDTKHLVRACTCCGIRNSPWIWTQTYTPPPPPPTKEEIGKMKLAAARVVPWPSRRN